MKELQAQILKTLIADDVSKNEIEYDGFDEVLGTASTFNNDLSTPFYELSEADQESVADYVTSHLEDGEEIDADVADSRGMIGSNY